MWNDKHAMAERMRQDGALILDHLLWPDPSRLHLKTQPWWKGEKEFGFIRPNAKTVVINKDPVKMNEGFDSISAMVEKWSVD